MLFERLWMCFGSWPVSFTGAIALVYILRLEGDRTSTQYVRVRIRTWYHQAEFWTSMSHDCNGVLLSGSQCVELTQRGTLPCQMTWRCLETSRKPY